MVYGAINCYGAAVQLGEKTFVAFVSRICIHRMNRVNSPIGLGLAMMTALGFKHYYCVII